MLHDIKAADKTGRKEKRMEAYGKTESTYKNLGRLFIV